MSTEPDKHLAKARALAAARCYGMCEGCGRHGLSLDPHHRKARGTGGVHGDAAAVANHVVNILMLCRSCHDDTEHADSWQACVEKGWRVQQHETSARVAAEIYTVNGRGWWLLLEDGGFLWATGRTPMG